MSWHVRQNKLEQFLIPWSTHASIKLYIAQLPCDDFDVNLNLELKVLFPSKWVKEDNCCFYGTMLPRLLMT